MIISRGDMVISDFCQSTVRAHCIVYLRAALPSRIADMISSSGGFIFSAKEIFGWEEGAKIHLLIMLCC